MRLAHEQGLFRRRAQGPVRPPAGPARSATAPSPARPRSPARRFSPASPVRPGFAESRRRLKGAIRRLGEGRRTFWKALLLPPLSRTFGLIDPSCRVSAWTAGEADDLPLLKRAGVFPFCGPGDELAYWREKGKGSFSSSRAFSGEDWSGACLVVGGLLNGGPERRRAFCAFCGRGGFPLFGRGRLSRAGPGEGAERRKFPALCLGASVRVRPFAPDWGGRAGASIAVRIG